MKIVLDQVWGSQERWDIGLVRPRLECSQTEEATALESGWLVYGGDWYLCRSVRISSNQTTEPFDESMSIGMEDSPDREEILHLWHGYIAARGYRDNWDLFSDTERSSWLMLRDGCGHLAGFTKLVSYHGGLESQHNAYSEDYGLKLGTMMIGYEAAEAQRLGLDHLYIGSGYEQGSRYKSYLRGFEFWDGYGWSGDRDRFHDLCRRDASVSNLDDLDRVWNHQLAR